jgi:hypothetical protein
MSDPNTETSLDDDQESFEERAEDVQSGDGDITTLVREHDNFKPPDNQTSSEATSSTFTDTGRIEDIHSGWIAAGVAFIIGGVLGVVTNPQNPIAGFLAGSIFFGACVWPFATPSGKEYMKKKSSNSSQNQHQSVGKNNNEIKRACPSCGWQNPQRNNYCHDCGTKIN